MPTIAEALQSGLVYQRAGQLEQAEQVYRQILQVDPSHIEARRWLGVVAYRRGKNGLAVDCLSEVLQRAPQFAEAHCDLGAALKAQGRLDEAVGSYQRALSLQPDYAAAHNNLGNVLQEQGKLEQAAASLQQARHLKPDFPEAHNNLGVVLSALGRLDDAAACLEQALRLRPQYAEAHNNLGLVRRQQGKLDEAVASFREALRCQPAYAEAHHNLGYTWLLGGNLEQGWAAYEWRWQVASFAKVNRDVTQRRWDGSPLAGRTILLQAEQGLGDTLQFIRYAPLVRQRGGHVVVACPGELLRLLKSCSAIDQFVDMDQPLPACDVQAPLLSLPGLLGTSLATIPAPVPYLCADPELTRRWGEELGQVAVFRIGIAWQGNPAHRNDRHRSLPLTQFERLARLPGVQLVSLQKGPGTEQLEALGGRFEVIALGQRFSDLAATAAAVMNLDLVVTVDSALAHLAGALGVPVWVALPYAPDWRWLLEREDSPWYPSMRLFRQRRWGDWADVFDRIEAALCERLRGGPRTPPGREAPSRDNNRSCANSPTLAGPSARSPVHPTTEVERRKQVIANRQTDLERWRNPAQLDPAWNQRARIAAEMIPAGATVLDLGCGSMALEHLLPPGCTYLPCDVVPRDGRTLVCNLNAGEVPNPKEFSHVTMLGVLEYLYDVPAFLAKLRSLGRPVILSYNAADLAPHIDRSALGWVNHLTFSELENKLAAAGLAITVRRQIDNSQVLLRLVPEQPRSLPRRTVLVVSGYRHGNFGDRLGYHLINELLPAHVTIHHVSMNFHQECRLEPVPVDSFDLLVLGIGNSLFGRTLTDDLFRVLERAPQAIGIFGTQYRQALSKERLAAVLNRLQVWYARSEEDILCYGKGCRKVVHLGDWLVSAFPLTHGNRAEPLTIGREVWNNMPLDRTIQEIQLYRKVFSTRLHPLLCALTSAEQVAYREQREERDCRGQPSGKFRSLLLDVFGRTFPEEQFFEVDRAAVALYKVKVQQRMAELRRMLATMLDDSKAGADTKSTLH